MYDPARDSWKSDEEENGLEKDSSPALDASDKPDEVTSSKAEEDSKSHAKEEKSEVKESMPKEEVDNTSSHMPEASNASESTEAATEKETVTKESEDKGDSSNENDKKRDLPDSPAQKPSELGAAVPSLPAKPQEPARKIRKPNSRLSQTEREAQARHQRERIERNERREEGGDYYDSRDSRDSRDYRDSRDRRDSRDYRDRDSWDSRDSRDSRDQRDSRDSRDYRDRDSRDSRNNHGENSIVRQHYNQRPDQGVQRRQESPIIKLRSFNNWIKFVLISKYSERGCTVLDIGCGKGGDLFKWGRAGCSGFIGVDIAEVSVAQARERYDKVRHKRFWADFCVGDAFEEPMETIVHPDAFPVDIVSSQFCLHYAFSSEERVRMALSNVSRSLRRGGIFLGTIPNSDVINKHIRKLEPHELKWGNSVYNVEFELAPPRDGVFKPAFGHKYTFFLEDAVGNVPEYVVPFEAFRALAEEYHLELEFKKPFLKLFDEELERNSWTLKTADSMGVVKADGSYGIEGDEREACGFYLAFAFRKTRD